MRSEKSWERGTRIRELRSAGNEECGIAEKKSDE